MGYININAIKCQCSTCKALVEKHLTSYIKIAGSKKREKKPAILRVIPIKEKSDLPIIKYD